METSEPHICLLENAVCEKHCWKFLLSCGRSTPRAKGKGRGGGGGWCWSQVAKSATHFNRALILKKRMIVFGWSPPGLGSFSANLWIYSYRQQMLFVVSENIHPYSLRLLQIFKLLMAFFKSSVVLNLFVECSLELLTLTMRLLVPLGHQQ